MSLVDRSTTDPSDAELISRVRGGDVDAYGQLFARHVDAANRLARSLVSGPDADDLVSESFSKVLNVLLGGGGPDLAFRAYLLTAVRRVHVDRIRSHRRAVPTEDLSAYDDGEPFQDTVVAGFEGGAAARAFASLPERWQMVLWHLEVEGQKPAQIAPLLGMSANSVSALAYRAREGLRQAFLQMHAADIVDDRCSWAHDKLGAYVRGGLSHRDSEKVEAHLDQCRRCTALYLELLEVNSSLAAVLGPLVLGGAAAAYLGATTSGAGAVAGLLGLFGRARDGLVANSQAVLTGGLAVAVTGAAVAGAVVLTHGPDSHVADGPVPSSVAPAPSPPAIGHSSTSRSPRGPGHGPTGTTTAENAPTPAAFSRRRAPATRSPSPRTASTTADTPTAPTSTSPNDGGAPAQIPPPAQSSPPVRHHSPPSSPDPNPSSSPSPPDSPGSTAPADISVVVTLTLKPLGVDITISGLPAGQQAQVSVVPLGKKGNQHTQGAVAGNGATAVHLTGIHLPFKVVVHVPGQPDTVKTFL